MSTIYDPSPYNNYYSNNVSNQNWGNQENQDPNSQGNTQVKDMEDLKERYPVVYNAVIKALAQTMIDALKAHGDRMKDAIRNNDGQH